METFSILQQTIRTRRSIRRWLDEGVPRADLAHMVTVLAWHRQIRMRSHGIVRDSLVLSSSTIKEALNVWKWLFAIFILIVSLLLSGCSSKQPDSPETNDKLQELVASPKIQPTEWVPKILHRWGVTYAVPATWEEAPPPANDDGRIYTVTGGPSFTISGIRTGVVKPVKTVEEAIDQEMQHETGKVTRGLSLPSDPSVPVVRVESDDSLAYYIFSSGFRIALYVEPPSAKRADAMATLDVLLKTVKIGRDDGQAQPQSKPPVSSPLISPPVR